MTNFQILLVNGFQPKDAMNKAKTKEMIKVLENNGMFAFDEIAEVLLDFQWYQATEADYELTRKFNEHNARKEQFNQFLQ